MDADYVIVGAGSAGCVLAARLSENPKIKVILIEAGGHDARLSVHVPGGFVRTMVDPAVNWMYRTQKIAGLGGRDMAMPRGRILGGTSSINGMLYVRGQKQDFDDWAQAGNDGWSYDEVLPYFLKSENARALIKATDKSGQYIDKQFHGQLGPLSVSALSLGPNILDQVIEGAMQSGFARNDDYNGHAQSGFGYFQVTQTKGLRQSAYRAFVHPVRHRPNLQILKKAHALKLLFDPEDKHRITGVEIQYKGRRTKVLAHAETILSAGAFGSPQILELSGIGQADRLASFGIQPVQQLAGVGESLKDHFLTRLTWRLKQNISLNHHSRGLNLVGQLLRYGLFRTGTLSLTAGILAGFVSSTSKISRPDIQFHIAHASFANPAKRIFDSFPGLTIGPCQLRPNSKGHVHISSPNPFDAPLIQPNYLADDEDQKVLLAGLHIARKIMKAPALYGLVAGEERPGAQVMMNYWPLCARQAIPSIIRHAAVRWVRTQKMGQL